MKQLILIISIITSGCANYTGLSVNQYDSASAQEQERLSPLGQGSFKVEFVNKSSQPIFININKKLKNFRRIETGKSWTYHSATKKDIAYTIKWWYKHNNFLSEEEIEMSLTLTALYEQDKIIIDDNFLRKKTLQKGVVVNYFPDPVAVYDSQGNDYGTLKPGEFKYGEVMSGPVTFYFIKKDRLWKTRRTKSYLLNVDNKKDVYFNGEWMGWKFYVQ